MSLGYMQVHGILSIIYPYIENNFRSRFVDVYCGVKCFDLEPNVLSL